LAITRSKIDFELGYKGLSITNAGVGRWSIDYPFHLDKIMERKDSRRMTVMEILPENIIKAPEGRNLGDSRRTKFRDILPGNISKTPEGQHL
jgi:hypothetical protein